MRNGNGYLRRAGANQRFAVLAAGITDYDCNNIHCFSISLTERARQLRLEDLQIRQRYRAASDQVKRTDTALMQTQIKPHFFYNTLTAIEQMCEINSQKAQAAIADFSNYLRSNIDFSTETKLIMVEKELENVKLYLSLE